MSKFIESEIYGSCDVNNDSTSYGKIYNDDVLYVSFSRNDEGGEILYTNIDLRIHVRRFDDRKTVSGVPMVHWWFAKSGSDASSNQGPYAIDDGGFGTITIAYTSGWELDPTVGTSIDAEGVDLHTAIANTGSHDVVINLDGGGDDNTIVRFLNVMVQGITYSEKFTFAHAV